jgi:hypothetical protein
MFKRVELYEILSQAINNYMNAKSYIPTATGIMLCLINFPDPYPCINSDNRICISQQWI